ncbi:hypothetical protein ACGFW5_00685 [Streptomyces sp. NPDC048416]|uniref:hypothetical protein n=1 Tax=Streptomyces sp. NPDC048416 TaxID=3365546 RepID=UPI00371883F6
MFRGRNPRADPPARRHTEEPDALVAAGGFWRLVPDGVPRGPYALPSLDVLTAALAGLQRRLEAVSSPMEYMPWLEPVPMPGCTVCARASRERARAHMAGDCGAVARATERIRQHPHAPAEEG